MSVTTDTQQFPPLFKRTANEGVQIWQVRVEPQDDGTAVIVMTYGLVDGKKQEEHDHVKEGKNPGKKNATTPLQQAYKEAEARWKKQRDRRHYGLDPSGEESAAKRAAAPMLAYDYLDHIEKVSWDGHTFAQPKLDGFRCLASKGEDGKITFMSRKGVEFDLPHLAEPLVGLLEPGDVLDGELYAHGVSLNKIGSWVKKAHPEREQLTYNVYDAPLTDVAFKSRLEFVQSRLANASKELLIVETVQVHTEEELLRFQFEARSKGYEGAILRWGDVGYAAGKRSDHLLKVKSWKEQEFKIVGFKAGKGDICIYRCVTDAGHTFDITAPGTMPEKKQALANAEAVIGRQLTVRFADWTKTDTPVPFHPTAITIREIG